MNKLLLGFVSLLILSCSNTLSLSCIQKGECIDKVEEIGKDQFERKMMSNRGEEKTCARSYFVLHQDLDWIYWGKLSEWNCEPLANFKKTKNSTTINKSLVQKNMVNPKFQ